MSFSYTANQQSAIELRGGTILVSAGAGSGKTAVLTERITSLLTEGDNPASPESLLVVTFTNAAASEMNSRVRSRMLQIAEQQPKNLAVRSALQRLNRAQISTIDSFCSTLLRENFNEADIAPDFSIADDARAEDMKAQAMAEVMDEMYSDPAAELDALSDLFGRSRSDDGTESVIRRTADFESNLEDPAAWEHKVINSFESPAPLRQSALFRIISQTALISFKAAQSSLELACALAQDDEHLTERYLPAILSDLQFIRSVVELSEKGSWDEAAKFASAYTPAQMGRVANGKYDPELKERVYNLRSKAKELIEKANETFTISEEDYLADCAVSTLPVQVLFDAVGRYKKRLLDIKREKRLYEFSDLERKALELLRDENGQPTAVALAARERFKHILVDEYQDSNALQDCIFKTISSDEQNLFFVGDIKQSIYSFRRADPEIFAKRARSCFDIQNGVYPMRINLRENFRSSHSVLDACNAIFSELMTENLGGTDYAAEGGLVPGPTAPQGDPAGVTIMVCDGTIEDEAGAVARRIGEMLRGGYTVQDSDNGELRLCQPEDFCILLRSPGKSAAYFIDALEKEGIFGWTDGKDSLFEQSEVEVIIALLRAADNPRRDTELAAAMLSPLFGFTPDDLLELRAGDSKAALYTMVAAASGEKIDRLKTALATIRADAAGLSAADTVRRCISSLDAETLLCAGECFTQRSENLRELENLAESLNGSADDSLSAFLRVYERAKEGSKSPQRNFAPPKGAVCVTSIHKSKGLEWPIVFVSNTGHGFNDRDIRDPSLLLDYELGTALKVKLNKDDGVNLRSHKTIHYLAAAIAMKRRNRAEELRLRYVALTRARYSLFISGCAKDSENLIENCYTLSFGGSVSEYDILGADSTLKWFLLAAFASTGNAGIIGLRNRGRIDKYPFTIELIPITQQAAQQTVERQIPEIDPQMLAALRERLAFTPPTLPLSTVPAKLAVTAIAEQRGQSALYRPAFARDGLTAAERGTAMHKFMQCADYAAASASAADELQRLVDGEYISAFDAEHINIAAVQRLFDSELGRRLTSAKKVMRELEFIDSLPSDRIANMPHELANERVLVQGIADCVLIEDDGAVIVDYKSDKVTGMQQLVERYSGQLKLYRSALASRLSVSIKSCVLYSFALADYVEID